MSIMKHKPKDFLLISGDDMWTCALYAMGGAGVISVLANAYPLIFRKVRTYSAAGQHEKANRELSKLLEINSPMYEEGNPVGVKYVLSTFGVCDGFVRQPLLPASNTLIQKIDALLQGLKNKG
jgi:4-hydroxy-tetrahydrodipicolinate synthase